MPVTINDIARLAGTSGATVSHVINKTRYVSPELEKRVLDAMEQTGYSKKVAEKQNKMMMGNCSVVAFVVPNVSSSVYAFLAAHLNDYLTEKGYMLATYITGEDKVLEQHILSSLISNKRIGGIILAPSAEQASSYSKLLRSRIPFVCLGRTFVGAEADSVTAENRQAAYRGTMHLLKQGHTDIALLVEDGSQSGMEERLEGYKSALAERGVRLDPKLIIRIDNKDIGNAGKRIIYRAYEERHPSAFLAAGNKLTHLLLQTLGDGGIDYPDDVSIVGFGDEGWCEIVSPPLTSLEQDTEKMAYFAAQRLLHIMKNGDSGEKQHIRVPVELVVRKSTQMIGLGPFGERATDPHEITLTNDERQRLRKGNFKVGISFHYGGTAWTRLHEKAIRDTLENFGVSVISVMDAGFDPALQVTQLKAISMQHPDLIVAIPTNDNATAREFKELSQKTRLVFMSNIPFGFSRDDYVACVSVNERENGYNAGFMMGEYFKGCEHVHAGFIQHGIAFYGTHLRDMVAVQTVREQYSNIEVTDIAKFNDISDAYFVCKDMLRAHPEITAMYVSWERPALEVIRALDELDRKDISVFTCDLDYNIAMYMAKGEYVRGISSQQPYKQGEAVAVVVAKALANGSIGEQHKYIGVAPYRITASLLPRAWKEIMSEPLPSEIESHLSE